MFRPKWTGSPASSWTAEKSSSCARSTVPPTTRKTGVAQAGRHQKVSPMTSQDDLPGAGPAPLLPPAQAASTASAASVPLTGRLDSVIEQFARDYIKDRRSERRWRIVFRGLWLLLIVLLFWSVLAARKAANL